LFNHAPSYIFKNKNAKLLITFRQCEIKKIKHKISIQNQRIKYDIFLINKGSSTENFRRLSLTGNELVFVVFATISIIRPSGIIIYVQYPLQKAHGCW
jgi:hypothetical protein